MPVEEEEGMEEPKNPTRVEVEATESRKRAKGQAREGAEG